MKSLYYRTRHKYLFKTFINFLKENNIYDRYAKYVVTPMARNYRTNHTFLSQCPIEFITDCIHNNGDSLVMCAFSWGHTAEGFEYWNNIHVKWENDKRRTLFLFYEKEYEYIKI